MQKIRRCTFEFKVNKDGKNVFKTKEGFWHQWGHTYEECETQGLIQLSVGLIEDDTGRMHSIEARSIQFHNPLKDCL